MARRSLQGDHPTTGRPQGCAPTMDELNKALRRVMRSPHGDHPTPGRPQGCVPTMDELNKALRRHSRGDGLSSPCGDLLALVGWDGRPAGVPLRLSLYGTLA